MTNKARWSDKDTPQVPRDLDIVPPASTLAEALTSRAMKIAEAEGLLDEAAKIIHNYARFVSFGDTYARCSQWLSRMEGYADEVRRVAATGEGWRETLPATLWRDDGDEWRLNDDNTYSSVASRMGVPFRNSYDRLMKTGGFSHEKP